MAVVDHSDLEVASIPFIYPALAVYAKRCHDRGESALWLLMLIVPIIDLVWFICELSLQPAIDETEALAA